MQSNHTKKIQLKLHKASFVLMISRKITGNGEDNNFFPEPDRLSKSISEEALRFFFRAQDDFDEATLRSLWVWKIRTIFYLLHEAFNHKNHNNPGYLSNMHIHFREKMKKGIQLTKRQNKV